MGFKNFIKKLGVNGDAEDEAIAGEDTAPAAEPAQPAQPASQPANNIGRGSDKVVDITSNTSSIREGSSGSLHAVHSGGNMKVVVIQPRSLDDSQQIANCLKEKRPVVINFEGVDDQLYRRILDFVSGTTYALDGSVNSISTRVWLFSPKNVNVSVSKQTNQSFSDMPWEKK